MNTTSAVTLVTQTGILPDCTDAFARWQQQVNDTIATFPGYLDHTIIPPAPPTQTDWLIIQRFQNVETARVWLQSEQRQHLLDDAQPILGGQTDVHLFTQDAPSGSPGSVSIIISTHVKPGQQDAYLRWFRRISALQTKFEGFQGYKFEPPIPGVQEDWVTILRFDSDTHLEAWLNSAERKNILQEADAFSLNTHVRKAQVGFDSWLKFTDDEQRGAPPAWKVNMLVLLALYPTVFLFSLLVQTPFMLHKGVPIWLALFIGNIVSTAILSWILMPPLSKLFGWWINPALNTPATPVPYWRSTGAGVALILFLYAALLLLFSQLA